MALTVKVLHRTALMLGLLGAILLAVLAVPIAELSFGNADYAPAIAVLSAAILFKLLADARLALLQGMRRIADLAKTNVLGASLGVLATIPLVYFLRERGVALAIVAAAALSFVTAWWYSHKVKVEAPHTHFPASEYRREIRGLLHLGIAFMASGLMMMGAAYAVRVMVLRLEGLDAAGHYQAAWALGGMYIGVVLQAMGADFYPRLVATADDNARCNRLVNEQTQISLLLGVTGVLATLVFAPAVLTIFYSTSFSGATEVLRWICLGVSLRMLSWPMGYIIIAKGDQRLFILTELAWTIVNVGLTYFCVRRFGLTGAGVAFFLSYVFHTVMIYFIVRRVSGFHWSRENKQLCRSFISLIALVFSSFYAFPPIWAYGIGSIAAVLSGIYALHSLLTLVGQDKLPAPVRRVFRSLGLGLKEGVSLETRDKLEIGKHTSF
jgi:PST family polysaccharide transporter